MNQVRDSLLLAAMTTVSVGVSSLLAFTDVTRAFLTPSLATIACSFPISLAVLSPGILLSDVMKSICGCIVGWALGAILYMLSGVFSSITGSKAIIATILSFPIVFGLVLSDPVCKSPISSFIQPSVAIITMYVMSSFAKDLAYVVGLFMLISYTVSSMITLLVFFSIRPVVEAGSTKTALRESLTEFQSCMTHWFEGATAFMLSASGHHGTDLDQRQQEATQALASVQAAMKLATEQDPLGQFKDPIAASNLAVTTVVMHSQLLAFRGTIFKDGYSDHSVKVILAPVRDALDHLRMTTVLALRPTTPPEFRQEAINRVSAEALQLYNDFARAVSFSASEKAGSLPETKEEIRLVFALTSVVRFAMLAQHLLTSAESATELLPPCQSLGRYLRTEFLKLFSRAAWRRTTNFRYAFRSALAQQVVAQLLLVLSKSYPTRVTPYIFWALMPVVSTFLSTVGGGLTVGSRNMLGCLAGASVGVVTALTNSGNREAIYLEMLIITFLAKFLSTHKQLNVAAITFASTWNVLSIPNVHIEELKVLLSLIGYRISLTTLGVFASALLSIILFPTFAASILRRSIARTVTTASSLVSEGIVGVIDRLPLRPSRSFDEEQSVCSSSFSPAVTVGVFEGAGCKALDTIHKHTALIPLACEEAIPELVLMDKFGWDSGMTTKSLASLIASEPLIQRLSDSACVFSSIAAATRVQENCHAVMFSKGFVSALQHVVDIIDGAAARIAASVMDPHSTLKLESRLTTYVHEVTRELFATRDSMEKSGLLGCADRGGWLLIYVFHFALVEFTAAWDDLAIHLDRKRRESTSSMGSLEESFVSPSPALYIEDPKVSA